MLMHTMKGLRNVLWWLPELSAGLSECVEWSSMCDA